MQKRRFSSILCPVIAVLLTVSVLLSGCGVLENMPKPPKLTEAAPTEPAAVPAGTEQNGAYPGGMGDSTPANAPAESAAAGIKEPEVGVTVTVERTEKEAFDPENGETRILTFYWDSVTVHSDAYPEAAARITETMAGLEDGWYTGSDEEGDLFYFGYNGMLAAAEDNYSFAKEYGAPMEFSNTRDVTVLRADDECVVFLVYLYNFMGGAHGNYVEQAVCFDVRTGEQLTVAALSANEAALRTRLLEEMMRLANEDKDGYYSERMALIQPEDYESALGALIREGTWYPANDAFHLFSNIYELGPYAAGITDFPIPYGRLTDVLDARWIPKASA